MACFLVTAAEAVVVTVAAKVAKNKEMSLESVKLEKNAEIETKQENKLPWSKKLMILASMLWGGAFLLCYEHIWHGEVVSHLDLGEDHGPDRDFTLDLEGDRVEPSALESHASDHEPFRAGWDRELDPESDLPLGFELIVGADRVDLQAAVHADLLQPVQVQQTDRGEDVFLFLHVVVIVEQIIQAVVLPGFSDEIVAPDRVAG